MRFPPDVIVTPQPWLSAARTKPIRFLEIHATRGSTSPDAQFQATINWLQSPHNRARGEAGQPADWGSSCSYIIGRDGRLARVLPDDRFPTYSAGYGGSGSTWSIDEYGISYEWCQSANQEEFTTEQYERAAIEYAAKSRVYGIPAVMLDITRQSGPVPAGFVRHDRCENGRKLGKTDPGPRFREADFVPLVREKLEEVEEMFTDEDRRVLGAVAMYTATLNAWRQNVEPHIVNADRVLSHELRPAIRAIVREELARLSAPDGANLDQWAEVVLDAMAARLEE
jgi:hypothetical protein